MWLANCPTSRPTAMAKSRIRHPQFSEDVAWLPVWLQHCQEESFSDLVKDPQTPSTQEFKELDLQENSVERKDASQLSREEGRFNSCHLFLSGEDNSSVSFASTFGQAMQFHLHFSLDNNMPTLPNLLVDTSLGETPELFDVLSMQQVETSAIPGPKANQSTIGYNADAVNLPHLSSDGITLDLPSLLMVRPQAERPVLNNVMSIQQVENSAVQGEHANQSKIDHNSGAVNALPLTSKPSTSVNMGVQFVTNKMDNENQYETNFNIRHPKDTDVNNAVELSIAASEALVIHELVKSAPSSQTFSAAAVLEVSLRLKQARPEVFFLSSSENNDEIDSLSDLDDITMDDAFGDVGLSVTGPDDECASNSVIYQVKETPSIGYLDAFDDRFQYMEHSFQKDSFVDNSAQKQLEDNMNADIRFKKDLPSEDLHYERQKELADVSTLGWNISNAVDLGQHHSTQETFDGLAIAQRISIPMDDLTSFQHQVNLNSSSQARDAENAEERKLNNVVSDRFRSRWIGGCTEKKVENSTDVKWNNSKSIPKIFGVEMSFLSESADVAPDLNSFVQKNESRSLLASQSSIPFEGLGDKANEGILHSQDIVRSSSLSSVDPLCSVVPCSISSESATSMQHQPFYQNASEFSSKKCFNPTSDFEVQTAHMISDVEVINENLEHVPIINRKTSRAVVRRQLTSLKTYSMVSPSSDAFLGRVTGSCLMECNLRVHPSEKNMDAIGSSGERDEVVVLPSRCTSKGTTGRYCENYHGTSNSVDQVVETASIKRYCDETANDGAEVQVLLPEKRSSPIILNHKKRRLLASRSHVDNFTEKGNPKCASALESLIELQHIKELPMQQSKSEYPCHAQITMRKRVRFSEVAVQLQQKKQLQKQQPSNKNSSPSRASKNLKTSNSWSDTRSQEVKRRLTNFCIKDKINRLVFQSIEFLLTGFSTRKESEIEGLVRKHGGVVLSDIPSSHPSSRGKRRIQSNRQQIPVVLCPKKLQTTKFLYGCAVNAYILKDNWLMDSIAAGSVLPPEKYMILSNQADGKRTRIGKPICRTSHDYIFERVGIMLHGKHSFCTKLTKIFKHGGGYVFKTLQWLVHSLDTKKISVGAIIAEDKIRASRHLRHCASEQKIPMMSARWIINSLHMGKLLPFNENNCTPYLSTVKVPEFPISMESSDSEEILKVALLAFCFSCKMTA